MTDYNKHFPYPAKIKHRSLLSQSDPSKKTYHVSLDIKGSDLIFHPGDSLAILPQNDPKFVQRILSLLQRNPNELIIDPRSQKTFSLYEYFSSKVNLARVNSSLILSLLQNLDHPFHQPENKPSLLSFLEGKDLIHVLEEFQISTPPLENLLEHFAPLLPRFYSISSSLKAHADEVHLLVALPSYYYQNEIRYGVASHFLCELASEDSTIPIYIQPSMHFKLPQDVQKDLIMVGPGTGVAPYRAFLQERILQDSSENPIGRNWLFFGGRNQKTDFFYEDFWSSLQNQQKLKLSTAFSRDQEEKVYVQHSMLKEAKELFQWLEGGAYFYVCGDASKMAKDVEATLLSIIQKEGAHSEESAKAYLKALKKERRYLTDVY